MEEAQPAESGEIQGSFAGDPPGQRADPGHSANPSQRADPGQSANLGQRATPGELDALAGHRANGQQPPAPQVPILPASVCAPADQWHAVMMCAQYPALRKHLYGLINDTAAHSGYTDARPFARQGSSQEALLTQLVGMVDEIQKKQQALEVQMKGIGSQVTEVQTSVTSHQEAAREQAAIVLRLADLTSECTRLVNVFNIFVLYVKSHHSGPPFSDTSDELFRVEVQTVPALAPHHGDRTLSYEALDNEGRVVPKASWDSLPYVHHFPEAKKLVAPLMNRYRGKVQDLCKERQTAARVQCGELDPDVLMTTDLASMADVQFVRVVYNTKGEVCDVSWPAFPLVEGAHNEPVPRAQRGEVRFSAHSSDLPRPPPRLPVPTQSPCPTGQAGGGPTGAPSVEEALKRTAAETLVSPGGLGRQSGNKVVDGSEMDSVLFRRMGELQDQVETQKRVLENMFARQDEPRKRHNSTLIQNSIDTIMALSGMEQDHQGATVIYPQAQVAMEKWTGKETDKIRNGSTWIRNAMRQAKRTRIPLIEFLEGAVEGPGQAWADGLSRAYSTYILQQTQIRSGDILIMNGQATFQGKHITLIPELTEEYITTNFHREFLHNKSNEVEDSMVSLYGGVMSQLPKESLRDYLLRFKGKVWDANLVLEDNAKQMISLVYNGLQPYLKQHGFKAKKGNAIFETFFLYEEFLIEKEATAIRLKDFGVSSPALPIRHVAPVFRDRDAWAEYTEVDFEDEEEDYYAHGMINALRPQLRSSIQKPKGRVPPTPLQVTIPGPAGKPALIVKKREVAFYLNFANDSADWPLNGTPFSAPLKDPTAPGSRPRYKEQVLMLMKFLRPTVSEAIVTSIFETAKAYNRDWVWCILHGSEAHHTHHCPCLLKAFPNRPGEYVEKKKEFRKQAFAAYLQQAGAQEDDYYSGEDQD